MPPGCTLIAGWSSEDSVQNAQKFAVFHSKCKVPRRLWHRVSAFEPGF
jgi:hypothetical protein